MIFVKEALVILLFLSLTDYGFADERLKMVDVTGVQTCCGATGSAIGATLGGGIGFGLALLTLAATDESTFGRTLSYAFIFGGIFSGSLFLSAEEVYAIGNHPLYSLLDYHIYWLPWEHRGRCKNPWPHNPWKEYKKLYEGEKPPFGNEGSFWWTFLGGSAGLTLGLAISYGLYQVFPQHRYGRIEPWLIVLTIGFQTSGEILGFHYSLRDHKDSE